MSEIDNMMKELNEAYRKKDYADMANIIKLSLLDAILAKIEEEI